MDGKSSTAVDDQFIEYSEIHVDKPNISVSVDERINNINLQYKGISPKFKPYEPLIEELIKKNDSNLFMTIWELIKISPKVIKVILQIIRIFHYIQEFAMNKNKWFDIVTTIIGIAGAIWTGVLPILQGDVSWEKIVSAILLAILGYFSKLNK